MTTPKIPQGDQIGAFARREVNKRRLGKANKCSICGETRPEALIPKSKPRICFECQRKRDGQSPSDDHHVGGEANSPVKVPTPVNDHVADLTVAQQRWPRQTRENPLGSPVLAAAGCIRGFIDYVVYLVKKTLLWIPEFLENLDAFLLETLGGQWWTGIPKLEEFAQKR
jgi:hypothetical protein